MDPRRSPAGVLSDLPPDSGGQPPIHTTTNPVPTDYGFGRDDDERVSILTSIEKRGPRRADLWSDGEADVSAQRVVARARDSPI